MTAEFKGILSDPKAVKEVFEKKVYSEPLDPEQDKIDQMLEASGQNPTLLGS